MLPEDYSSELYHYGVLGMKWGVRRYRNKDGTLTDAGKKRLAKDLKSDYKKNSASAQSNKLSDTYKKTVKNAIDQNITSDDRRRLSEARKKWESGIDKSDKALNELLKIGDKYTKEFFCGQLLVQEKYADNAADNGHQKKIQLHYPHLVGLEIAVVEEIYPRLGKAAQRHEKPKTGDAADS